MFSLSKQKKWKGISIGVILTCNTGLKYHRWHRWLNITWIYMYSITSLIRFTVDRSIENFGNIIRLKRTFVFSRRIALRDFGQLSPWIRLRFRQYNIVGIRLGHIWIINIIRKLYAHCVFPFTIFYLYYLLFTIRFIIIYYHIFFIIFSILKTT